MTAGGARLPKLSAALAGVPACVQTHGPWAGRRQLQVRFADEAETAIIHTASSLRAEIARLLARSRYHSVTIAGRDPLAEAEFLAAAFGGARTIPVMLEHDGQRPDALKTMLGMLDLVQVMLDGTEHDAALERAAESLACAAAAGVAHALVIVPAEGASDAQLLRVVEQAHAASPAVSILLQPSQESASNADRRWELWLERATAVHEDVRLLPVSA